MQYILGIESSCDETAASVVADGRTALSNVILSQIDTHKPFGGVVPEIASRKHVETIDAVVSQALAESGLGLSDISAVAVTCGPGLVGALLVGLSYGKALSFACDKPLVGVHHIEGHIAANYIGTDLEPPYTCLVVSGGHTSLIEVPGHCSFTLLGQSLDDAAGEAFDKVSRALGLGYPGGVQIERLARHGDERAVDFPRAMRGDGYDFSFSGLKSAVLNYLNKAQMAGREISREDVAASFQKAVCDVLVDKTMAACKLNHTKILTLSGGVSRNSKLRADMSAAAEKHGIKLYIPQPDLCSDNAAMIASAGYFRFKAGFTHGLDLNAYPALKIGAVV